MRNRTEFLWLAVILVVAGISVRWMRAGSAPPTTPPVVATVPIDVDFPRSHAPLARTSFRFERVSGTPDGKRRIYQFSIHGTPSGADYEASLAFDGRTSRNSGHLSEPEYRLFFDRLEQHGAWKLVDVGRASGSDDHSAIYVQAGDWAHSVTLGPDYRRDKLASTFVGQVDDSVAGLEERNLEAAVPRTSPQ
jgi:hypothetical protein